ncbi:MAG: M28 family peptidase [Ignavibacteriales bacterium]|nr:M28 family peptidase [Ignavibacteriales bacterium]
MAMNFQTGAIVKHLFPLFVLVSVGFARQIPGFFPENAEKQKLLERQAMAAVSARSAEQFLYDLTKEPHHAGSPGAKRVAEYVQRRFREFGFDSRLVEYHVLLPYPVDIRVTLLSPIEKELSIKEEVEFHPDALIPFNSYSPSGDVAADAVYANYGTAEDFKRLHELSIEVKGKIVIARYGKIYRGLKVLEATKAGAVGVILYSDPVDDGYAAGDVYPRGPMRPWDGVQRGSIRFSERYPGDPLTPGIPAKKNAKRIRAEEDPDMPQIPCTPISYADAQHILKTLEGPSVIREWQGGLPFTYHYGPGPTRLRLQLTMDFQIRPIWNNIAILKGSKEPEKQVILGGHRDGWVFGAQDPNSGSTVLLEAARVIGEQVKLGWKPSRTLVFAQWDAEEFGLIGSTEWGEEFRDELAKNAVVYMNFDGSVSGPNFGASSSPLLDDFIQSLTRDVDDPSTNAPVFATWWQNQNKEKKRTLEQTLPEAAAITVGRMGGGSDHVVFQNHIGVSSLGFGFGGQNGIYHSYYDNFDWMKRFGDPGFTYHATTAKLAALAAMRMANADILPFTIWPYAEEIIRQLQAIEERAGIQNETVRATLKAIQEKCSRWKSAAERADHMLAASRPHVNAVNEINGLLMSIERQFVGSEGLPGRSWYKHRVVAASGYASVGLPGISAAVETAAWDRAVEEASLFDAMLDKVLVTTDRINSILQP